ncbi:hypothetical protein P691DRAFT_664431 [Macrolepiota fuliginosa MF-IS2]|uniref:Uncharacterized protein n=1 Tax=Macrolepiota fuliginosa MF-IS2 TaxID=1400762 RepID=A0A9P5XI91_9AGAR|nr:hypothetical protein P691DRAFT_664431 [Macrolepiota fuliginosa MF-IS2]
MPSLPLELVSEIIYEALEFSTSDTPGTRSKPRWELVSSLSVTCKSYRILVLKAWFCRLYTEDHDDTAQLTERILQVDKNWVKQIHCVQRVFRGPRSRSWNLQGYERLELVRLDWLDVSIPHQGSSFERSEYIPFINAPDKVATFDFRGLRWPYPNAYLFIQQCLPSIKHLVLYQQEVWCGLCFTPSEVEFAEPIPTRLLYEGGFGLPIHYATALKSLEQLEQVTIHIPAAGTGLTSVNETCNENMWIGECDACIKFLYTDCSFVDAYVARKRGGIFRLADGTEKQGLHPPRLKSVEWVFVPLTAHEYDLSSAWEEVSEGGDLDSNISLEGDISDVTLVS